jgi:hypothetical protein
MVIYETQKMIGEHMRRMHFTHGISLKQMNHSSKLLSLTNMHSPGYSIFTRQLATGGVSLAQDLRACYRATFVGASSVKTTCSSCV